jgi:hypothetical protein
VQTLVFFSIGKGSHSIASNFPTALLYSVILGRVTGAIPKFYGDVCEARIAATLSVDFYQASCVGLPENCPSASEVRAASRSFGRRVERWTERA